MKRTPTSNPSAFSKEQVAAAIAAAPEKLQDVACPYDPNDAAVVAAYWAKGKLRLPGQRGPQKLPTKIAVTVRYSAEVVEHLKLTGEGWQTRMNEALQEYIQKHRVA